MNDRSPVLVYVEETPRVRGRQDTVRTVVEERRDAVRQALEILTSIRGALYVPQSWHDGAGGFL